MAQDLRELVRKGKIEDKFPMKAGHKERFAKLLEKELPNKRKPAIFKWSIAASFFVFLGLGLFVYKTNYSEGIENTTVVDKPNTTSESKGISLGDLSPDLKRVEDYYVVNINMELSKLDVSENNKALVDSYMKQLSGLDREYKLLNTELNSMGPNDQTITALIKNLQLRLQLLLKLKNKLNELKSSENETVTTNSI